MAVKDGLKITANRLEALYRKYNRREYVDPDPLSFLYDFPDVDDREIVALIASSLAYGRVAQILISVRKIIDVIGPSPRDMLLNADPKRLREQLADFKHRFATGTHMADLLLAARGIIREHGSLRSCFYVGFSKTDTITLSALDRFCNRLVREVEVGHLVPLPSRGSACKRMNLFLRWMVRQDAVDPGGWNEIPASALIIPLDVHMHRVGALLGLTARKQADMRTALEITQGFARLTPDDPVRYDFVLTRPGIWRETDVAGFLRGDPDL